MSHALSLPWPDIVLPKAKRQERDGTPFRDGDVVISIFGGMGGMVFIHPEEGPLLFVIDPERGIFIIEEVPDLFTSYRTTNRAERRSILQEMKPGLTFGQDDPTSYEPLDCLFAGFARKHLVPKVRKA